MSAATQERALPQERMPALYLSHGAPPLADDPVWPGELAALSAGLPRPKAILMVSAHWEEAPLALGAVDPVPLVYDFWGFPEHYYRVKYDAPGAPELAESVRKLLRAPGVPVQDIPDRGLDHGAYVPLVEMFPAADIPVLQISMPTLDPVKLMDIGRKLAPLRDEGVLIVGSGFFTHNLAALRHPGGECPAGPRSSTTGAARAGDTGLGRSARLPPQGPGRPVRPSAHRAFRPALRDHGHRGGDRRAGRAEVRDRRVLDGAGEAVGAVRLTRPRASAGGSDDGSAGAQRSFSYQATSQ